MVLNIYFLRKRVFKYNFDIFQLYCRSVRTASIPAFGAIVENVTDKTVGDSRSRSVFKFVTNGHKCSEVTQKLAHIFLPRKFHFWQNNPYRCHQCNTETKEELKNELLRSTTRSHRPGQPGRLGNPTH